MMYTNAEEIGITDGICMFLVDATTNEYIGSNLKYGAEVRGLVTRTAAPDTRILDMA